MPAALALPELGLMAAGLLLMLIAFALWVLRDLLTGVFRPIPWVGSRIADGIATFLDGARRDVVTKSKSSLSGVTRLFRWGAGFLGYVLSGIGHLFTDIVTTIDHLVRVQIPHLFDVARHETAVLFDGLRHDAARWFDDARHQIAVTFDGLRHDTLAWINDVRLYVDRRVTAAEVQATAQAKAIYTDLETWGDEAVSGVWRNAGQDIDALRRVLGRDFPGLGELIPALEGAGAAGLLGALIRSIAGTAVATRFIEECGIPNCRNLGQLGKDLSELGSAASSAAMLGWMVFIATDPVRAADDTVAVGEPFVSTLFGPLTSLLSEGIEHL